MPKELINDPTQQRWHTEVSWRRKPGLDPDDQGTSPGHVQLATVNLDSPFEFPEKDTGDHYESGERFDGWRVTLDETGIDRLIKALHKAKRQAFPEVQTREHHAHRLALGFVRQVECGSDRDDELLILRDALGYTRDDIVALLENTASDGAPPAVIAQAVERLDMLAPHAEARG